VGKLAVVNPKTPNVVQFESASLSIKFFKKSVIFIKHSSVNQEKFEKEIKEMLERRNINSGLEFQYHTNKKYCFELDINTKKDSNIVECLEVTYPMAHDH
jgi:hypothetical protein